MILICSLDEELLLELVMASVTSLVLHTHNQPFPTQPLARYQSANVPFPWVLQSCDSVGGEWMITQISPAQHFMYNLAFIKIRYFSMVRKMYSQKYPSKTWRANRRAIERNNW